MKYVWVKKCMEKCIILFKMWKCEFELTHQTSPKYFLSTPSLFSIIQTKDNISSDLNGPSSCKCNKEVEWISIWPKPYACCLCKCVCKFINLQNWLGPVWYMYLKTKNCCLNFFWKYVWVKKCVEIHEMLFKNWKLLFGNTHQTPP